MLLGDDIECNNIYVCLAKDVIREDVIEREETTKSVYFPHLGSVMPQKDTETIDEMYRVYYNRNREIVSTNGIQSFTMEIETHHPRSLNIVFRNLHSDAEFPFIQYNRGFHTDNIYRLYGLSITKNGKRIPLLTKEKIVELANTTTAGQLAILSIPWAK